MKSHLFTLIHKTNQEMLSILIEISPHDAPFVCVVASDGANGASLPHRRRRLLLGLRVPRPHGLLHLTEANILLLFHVCRDVQQVGASGVDHLAGDEVAVAPDGDGTVVDEVAVARCTGVLK